MGQGRGNLQLHLHAFGEFGDLLFSGQAEPIQISKKCFLVPVSVKSLEHGVHLIGIEALVEGQLVKDRGNLFLNGVLVFDVIQPQHADCAAVGLDDVQQCPDGGCFAGPVLTDKAHDAALWHGKAHVIQSKAIVTLG